MPVVVEAVCAAYRQHAAGRDVPLGLATAGPQDLVTGSLLSPTNLGSSGDPRRWPLLAAVRRRLRVPIFFDNDAAAAAWAEHKMGALKGADNSLTVTLGTGVGVGVVLNGEPLRAGPARHPEAGHLLLNPDDTALVTGAHDHGTVESYLGGPHFVERLRRQGHRRIAGVSAVADAAQQGEAWALEAFATYGRRLGQALFNYCVLFYPEAIALAGGVSHAARFFLPATRDELGLRLGSRRGVSVAWPAIRVARFQDEAGCLGAGLKTWATIRSRGGTRRSRKTKIVDHRRRPGPRR
jgi:glucokinase